jgi:hypothetical protein
MDLKYHRLIPLSIRTGAIKVNYTVLQIFNFCHFQKLNEPFLNEFGMLNSNIAIKLINWL